MNNLSPDGSEATRRGTIIIGKVTTIDHQYYERVESRYEFQKRETSYE